ncbi:unnamed protein product [Lathyrus oleraceus]
MHQGGFLTLFSSPNSALSQIWHSMKGYDLSGTHRSYRLPFQINGSTCKANNIETSVARTKSGNRRLWNLL